jgi:large subunit ribosomal protein L29
MKQSEVKGYSQEELKDKLAESQKAYADLKRTHVVSPLRTHLRLLLRKTVARLKDCN